MHFLTSTARIKKVMTRSEIIITDIDGGVDKNKHAPSVKSQYSSEYTRIMDAHTRSHTARFALLTLKAFGAYNATGQRGVGDYSVISILSGVY